MFRRSFHVLVPSRPGTYGPGRTAAARGDAAGSAHVGRWRTDKELPGVGDGVNAISGSVMRAERWDDLDREVYGIFGIPVDAVDRRTVVQHIRRAASTRQPLLLSTPNLNFLIESLSNEAFRESLLRSDLCPADGMPIVWLSRLLGAPIPERVAGSDVFEALKNDDGGAPRLKVFLFGGPEGVADRACRTLNSQSGALVCVGSLYPGFGDVEEMSTESIIPAINGSAADFLFVSLGAQKGQAWLLKNRDVLNIPVKVHLGATINFQSGDVQRAPLILRKSGLEWLWRIRQEPHLWRRYWRDGRGLLALLVTRALPLITRLQIAKLKRAGRGLEISYRRVGADVIVTLSGSAIERNIDRAIPPLRDAVAMRGPVVMDMSGTEVIDSRFTGLMLMVRKHVERNGGMRLVNVPRPVATMLKLNGFGYLFESGDNPCR